MYCRCCRCGNFTEWDDSLGFPPYCVRCWDKEVNRKTEAEVARSRKYRSNHWTELKKYNRIYRIRCKLKAKVKGGGGCHALHDGV